MYVHLDQVRAGLGDGPGDQVRADLGDGVAKMASHAIFQYNVLVIDIDNTTLGLI